MHAEPTFQYDIAVSFAGEDRSYVESVVGMVKEAGFTVFYDGDNSSELWGEELTEYFADIYENRARFAVMFVPRHYAEKAWTRLERRSILVRSMNQASPYLLPVRLDSTSLPGMRSTVGYLDGIREGAAGVAAAIKAKLGQPEATGEKRFTGRVPRTESEVATLLGERPAGWEYLLWTYLFNAKVAAFEEQYNDHVIAFTLPTDYVPDSHVIEATNRALAKLRSTTNAFTSLLESNAQTKAFGEPGESGSPELIEHFSERLAMIYRELIRWAQDLRGHATQSTEAKEVFVSLAQYAIQPIEAIRGFGRTLQVDMDALTARLAAEEDIKISMTITFEIPDVATKRYNRAIKKFQRKLR